MKRGREHGPHPTKAVLDNASPIRVVLTYRFELDLNDRQSSACSRHAALSRRAWNWALTERKTLWETREGKDRFVTCYDQQKAWVAQKPEWAYALSSWAAVSAIEDLEQAFKAFWKGIREKRRGVGMPRFRVKGKSRESFRLRGNIHVERRRVKLPILGWLRIKGSTARFRAERICYAVVSREAGRWFVSFTVERNSGAPSPPSGKPVGIDLGLTHFATLSDGTVIEAPRPLRATLRKIRRQQRAISRSQRNSNVRKTRVAQLARTHARAKRIRVDFLHKQSHQLTRHHVAIGVETLGIANLSKNPRVARAISDMGWGEFLRQLKYKSSWYGSTLVSADRFFPSTKMCSGCGALVDVPLSQRIYRCAVCGLVLDRDLNAARNLCPVAVTPTETLNASGGNVSPSSAWQIPVKLEPSTQTLMV